jgi:hypothetical protein
MILHTHAYTRKQSNVHTDTGACTHTHTHARALTHTYTHSEAASSSASSEVQQTDSRHRADTVRKHEGKTQMSPLEGTAYSSGGRDKGVSTKGATGGARLGGLYLCFFL